jgi:hypothetical protein
MLCKINKIILEHKWYTEIIEEHTNGTSEGLTSKNNITFLDPR